MVKTISVNELRLHLPGVLQELKQGVRFVLIYRSRPIGELNPIENIAEIRNGESSPFEIFSSPPPSLRFKSKKSAVNIVRKERS